MVFGYFDPYKQQMFAIRMLFSWLTEKGILAMNPARHVKTKEFSRTEGKTPAGLLLLCTARKKNRKGEHRSLHC